MNSVIEYVLNNDNVSVCIIALNYEQARIIHYDINNKLVHNLKEYMILHRNVNYIELINGSCIDFVSNQTKCFHGRYFNLMLFNNNVYERNTEFYLYAEKIGILSY